MAEPTASAYPAALDSATTLFGDAVNLTQLTLDAPLSLAATAVSVAESIAAINTPCYLLVEAEIIYAENTSAGDFSPVTRGAGGTSAATHTSGKTVYVVYAANYHNQVKKALIAIETELGIAPKTIDDTAAPGATPASVAAYLDMVANRIKSISGAANWYTAGNRFNALTAAGNIDLPTSSELTISGGSITPTQNWHTVDTEADAASDDLDTIAITNASDGFILFIRPNNDARTVVIKHNTGNILCPSGEDVYLDDQQDMAILIYDATLSKWILEANTFNWMSVMSGPAGFMVNGQISVTVASNNLTVALVTKAGTAATAANPIYVYLGGGWRKIVAALSVTINAGANTFNSGAAEFATKEMDYFVYLRYNATDGVCIGPARFPNGKIYSDFSTTATNEKYAAWNTTASAAASDECQVIGRFGATLSAGAGYTWTVPTYTPANLIQRPIYDTRWMDWVPTWTNLNSATATIIAKFQMSWAVCRYQISLVFGASTAVSGAITYSLPFSRSVFTGVFANSLVRAYDSNPGVSYPMLSYFLNATSAFILAQNSAGTYLATAATSSTVPFTWAVNDELTIYLSEYAV